MQASRWSPYNGKRKRWNGRRVADGTGFLLCDPRTGETVRGAPRCGLSQKSAAQESFSWGLSTRRFFTPAWFVLHELLPEAAAEHADLEVAHPQLAKFSTEWLRLEATPDRFPATTQEGPYVRVRDLVVRVFSEYLPHTPVTVVGINRDVHFRAPSAEARDRWGSDWHPRNHGGRSARDLVAGPRMAEWSRSR